MENNQVAVALLDDVGVDINTRLQAAAEKGYNLVTPITKLYGLPDIGTGSNSSMYRISLRVVQLSPDPERKDVYSGEHDYFKDDEVAISKIGLMKIAAAAGITWSPSESGRVDDRKEPHRVEFRMVGKIQDFDGSWRKFSSTKEVDLRDGSPQIEGWKPNRTKRARSHIESLAETKAMLRAIRNVLYIKDKYKKKELELPFVVPKLVFFPDMSDPLVKQMVTASALGVELDLYGAPREVERVKPSRLAQPQEISEELFYDSDKVGETERPSISHVPPETPKVESVPDKEVGGSKNDDSKTLDNKRESQILDFKSSSREEKEITLKELSWRKGVKLHRPFKVNNDQELVEMFAGWVTLPDKGKKVATAQDNMY